MSADKRKKHGRAMALLRELHRRHWKRADRDGEWWPLARQLPVEVHLDEVMLSRNTRRTALYCLEKGYAVVDRRQRSGYVRRAYFVVTS